MVLLPPTPTPARGRCAARLLAATGHNVAVVVTDTAGRAWRQGQTDLAIGAAGFVVLDDHAGRVDGYGNPLAVTAPALADEVAGAADLAQGKLAGRPVAVVRGLAAHVLRADDDGPGARSLNRPLAEDMFALGAREAVVAALAGESAEAFGAPAPAADLVAALARVGVTAAADGERVRLAGEAGPGGPGGRPRPRLGVRSGRSRRTPTTPSVDSRLVAKSKNVSARRRSSRCAASSSARSAVAAWRSSAPAVSSWSPCSPPR